MMSPLRLMTRMQFAQRKSTPFLPASESSPASSVPGLNSAPGGLAPVAFRHRPATGKVEIRRHVRQPAIGLPPRPCGGMTGSDPRWM